MPVIKLEKVDSTQLFAKRLENPEIWTIVLAKEQRAGHGRKGDSWYSPAGGLYFSLILPRLDVGELQNITILAASVVAGVIKKIFKVEPFIKPPNDLYLNKRKICGIITENVIRGGRVRFSVMGIGLNTNIKSFPQYLGKEATSLKIELGRDVDNREILKQITKGLRELIKNYGF